MLIQQQTLSRPLLLFLTLLLVGLLVLGWRLWPFTSNSAAVTNEWVADYQALRSTEGSQGGSWLRTLDAQVQEVQGDLIWNNAEQRGVMRIINLPDPQRGYRYHVWIYDAHRPTLQAISVAVLDSGSGKQEWYVPLVAAEPVLEPYKLVLTLEPIDPTRPASSTRTLLMVQL